MNITPELFQQLIRAASGYQQAPFTFHVVEDGVLEELVRQGGRPNIPDISDIGDYRRSVEFHSITFRGITESPLNTLIPTMTDDRRNEIAYKVLLYWAFKEGRQIGESTPRELGNMAKVTEIPHAELRTFMEDLFGTLVKEVFSAQDGMRFRMNKLKAEGKVKES